MENNIKNKVESFIETFKILKKEYRWSIGDLTQRFVALIYSISNKEFNKDEFNEMTKYIKENSKLFSNYRGHQKHSTAALLLAKFTEPQKAFNDLLMYEEKMKTAGFRSSQHLSISAYALLLTCKPEDVNIRAQKAIDLYKEMKKNHFWLTGSDDYPIAVLLSESNKNTNTLISEMEKNYELLHQKGFSRSNGLQFLSHILTFVQGDAQAKTQQIRDIYDRLKKEKFHVSSTYYGILGYLSLLGEHSNQAVDETIEVVRYLKTQKGFKWVDKNMNVLTATALVSSQYIEKFKENNELLETGIGISIETMISAQTAALVASVSATTVAASAGS